jgi:hypothetical protein
MPLLNAKNFEIAKLLTRTASHPQIDGLYVCPKFTAVTDGNLLIVVPAPYNAFKDFPAIPNLPVEPTSNFRPFLLERAEALQVVKNLGRKSNISALNCVAVIDDTKNDMITIINTDLSRVSRVETRWHAPNYPDVAGIIWPRDDATFGVNMNAALWSDLMGTIAKLNGAKRGQQKPAAAMIHFKSNKDPIRIDVPDHEGEQAVIAMAMPLSIPNLDHDIDSTDGLIRAYRRAVDPKNEPPKPGQVSLSLTLREKVTSRLKKLKKQIEEMEGLHG